MIKQLLLASFVLTAFLLMPGCAQPAGHPTTMPLLQESVTYLDNKGEQIKVTVGQGIILDAKGANRDAILIDHQRQVPIGQVALDSSLRQVRTIQWCVINCGEYALARWDLLRGVAPYGYGLPLLMSQGPVAVFAESPDAGFYSINARSMKDGLILSVHSTLAGQPEVLAGSFEYSLGSHLPRKIAFANGQTLTEMSRDLGLPFTGIDSWPLLQPIPGPQGLLLPGADLNLFDQADSPERTLRGLLDSEPEARAALNVGCLVNFQYTIAPKDESSLMPTQREVLFRAGILSGNVTVWEFSRNEDSLLGNRYESRDSESAQARWTCDELRRSPHPSMSLEAVLVFQQSVRMQSELLTIHFENGPLGRRVEPNSGWSTVRATYQPAVVNGSFVPHEIALDANSASLLYVLGPPSQFTW